MEALALFIFLSFSLLVCLSHTTALCQRKVLQLSRTNIVLEGEKGQVMPCHASREPLWPRPAAVLCLSARARGNNVRPRRPALPFPILVLPTAAQDTAEQRLGH